MEDTVDPGRSRAATWGDLSEHTATLLRDSHQQRVEIEQSLRLVRAELREDSAHVGRQLRGDLAQTRHELAVQLELLTNHPESLLSRRAALLLGALLLGVLPLAQLVLLVAIFVTVVV